MLVGPELTLCDNKNQACFLEGPKLVMFGDFDRYIESLKQWLYVDIVDTEQRFLDLRVISTHCQELLKVHDTVPIKIKFLQVHKCLFVEKDPYNLWFIDRVEV